MSDRECPGRRFAAVVAALALGTVVVAFPGCARVGHLRFVADTVSTAKPLSGSLPLRTLLSGDSLIGFVPGTEDSTRRYLGRLHRGFTADTLHIILFGDNRPNFRLARLKPEFRRLREMFSLNPLRIVRGLITIPVVLVKGMYPDLALVREIVPVIRMMPTHGREKEIQQAIIAKLDSLELSGRNVAALINTGDLVKDGRRPAHWERFLRLSQPLTSRVPYMPIAGNHERIDSESGLANWQTATGLPSSGNRIYYCFDSADGWVRFLALDSNPMTDPQNHWPREFEIEYSDEQIDWLVARLKEHRGPAFVFLHHPPFSAGHHRDEWQNDDVLRERRERMVRALHEAGIGIIAAGHEHNYQRAIFTWPDAVMINLVSGGAGSPLHDIPPPAVSARLYSEYKVAGATVKPVDVFTAQVFHFIHLRLWFGGGDFYTYAVQEDGAVKLIDNVQVDLKRFGIPKVDQMKIPVPPEGPTQQPPSEETRDEVEAEADTVSSRERIQSQPPPGTTKTPSAPSGGAGYAEARRSTNLQCDRRPFSPEGGLHDAGGLGGRHGADHGRARGGAHLRPAPRAGDRPRRH